MKKYLLSIYMFFCSYFCLAQNWNNENVTIYQLNNFSIYYDCNYMANSAFVSKVNSNYIIYFATNYQYLNISNFSLSDTIQRNAYSRFLYKTSSSDTMYNNMQSSFINAFHYLLFKNDSIITYTNGTITNSFDRMWMGKFYFDLQIDGSSNIIVRNRNLSVIRDTAFNFNPDNLFNYYSFIFNEGSNFDIYNNSNNKPNFRLQHLNDSTCLFTYVLGNAAVENTLYTYKISYHNNNFVIEKIAELKKIEITRRQSPSLGCENRFILNDFFYTDGLDSLFVCYVNYKDTVHHFSLGVNGVDFPPQSAGVYLFSLIEPSSVKRINQTNFTIYPNPSTGEINVSAKGNKTVYNYLGQKILETTENKFFLRKGMYVVEAGGVRKKVIVE